MPHIQAIAPTINTAERMLQVAAYCRVSSNSDDQLNSFAAQVDHYTKLIGGNPGWQMVDIYADEGLTGTRADTRPDFQRLLKDCRKGKIDKVLIKSISRFSRNTKDCLTSIRELKSLGVEIFFEKESINTGDMSGEMLLGFYGTLAQEESVSISNNMRWSYKRRMQSGQFITCRAPYGYQMAGRDLVIDADEAPIVHRIYNEYAGGKSMDAIAADLLIEGIPKAGGHWTRRSVEIILQNEKYTGNALLQKRYMTDTVPFTQAHNKGERDQYYLENSHPAIISKEDFEQAKALRLRRTPSVSLVRKQYPFGRKIICGSCGKTFKRTVTNDIAYWVCRSHFEHKDKCPVGRIPEPYIEEAFVRLWNKLRLNRGDILYPMLSQLEELSSGTSKRNSRACDIELEIASLNEQNLVLNRLRTKGYMDSVLFMQKSNEINTAINALRNERRRLLDDTDDEIIAQTRALIDILESGPKNMKEFDPLLFGETGNRIVVASQIEVCFRLKNGLELTESVRRIRR